MEHFTLGSRYYYSRLPEFEQTKYREIYDCWVTGQAKATMELPGKDFTFPSGLGLDQFVEYILSDNPHLFHLDLTRIYYKRRRKKVTLWSDTCYSAEETEELNRELKNVVDSLVQQANQLGTDYEKARFFHDYLVKNVVYTRGGPDERSLLEVHTIVGSLLHHRCVCDGYSRAFRLLCDKAHISCIVALGDSSISGDEGRHAWNFIKLDNQVYHCDVTWDSTMSQNGYPLSDYYFLRRDDIFAQEHSWDTDIYHPVLQDHPKSLKPICDKWEMEKFILSKIQKDEKNIGVYVSDTFPGMEAAARLIDAIIQRNQSVFIEKKIGPVSYTYDSMRSVLEIFL